MKFSIPRWKTQTQNLISGFFDTLKTSAEKKIPLAIYGSLCGLSLWPLLEASKQGQVLPVMMALGSVAGGIGGNLIANQIQIWRDQANDLTQEDIIFWVKNQVPANEELRDALDSIIEELELISTIKPEINSGNVYPLYEMLLKDLIELGNLNRFQNIISNSGVSIIGPYAS